MAYIAKSLRRINDPETGWEIEHPFGDSSLSAETMALVPKNIQRGPGPCPFVFSRSGRFYLRIVGAGYQLDGERYIFFDRGTLRRKWEELLLFGRHEVAPEIGSFEEFLELLRTGVHAFVWLTKGGMPKAEEIII